MATSSLVEQAAGCHRNISAVPRCAMVWCMYFTVILRRACALEGVLLERGHGCSGQLHRQFEISRRVEITHISVRTSQTSCICRIVHPDMKNSSSFIHASCLSKPICLFFFCGRQISTIHYSRNKLQHNGNNLQHNGNKSQHNKISTTQWKQVATQQN